MKKLNLMVAILLATIVLVSCEKKDSSKEVPVSKSSWVLTESNIEKNGIVCDKYINANTGQEVFVVISSERSAIYYDRYYHEHYNKMECDHNGHSCAKYADGSVYVKKSVLCL